MHTIRISRNRRARRLLGNSTAAAANRDSRARANENDTTLLYTRVHASVNIIAGKEIRRLRRVVPSRGGIRYPDALPTRRRTEPTLRPPLPDDRATRVRRTGRGPRRGAT